MNAPRPSPHLCATCVHARGSTCVAGAPGAERLKRGERVLICGQFQASSGRRDLREG